MSEPSASPIVVVTGLPRSGTSMMMQVLEAGGIAPLVDDHRPADADNPRGYYELAAVKNLHRDASCLSAAPGKAVKVIHHLLTALPATYSYRIVFMQRPMDQVLASQARMLERLGKAGANLSAEALGKTFQHHLDRVDAWLARQSNIAVLRIDHGSAIADPAAMSHAVNAFLGGGLDEAAMAGVVDPGLHRQRS